MKRKEGKDEEDRNGRETRGSRWIEKWNVQISVQYFSIKWENHKGGGGGDNQDKCVWYVNVFLGLTSWCFIKSLCRVLLMMAITVSWTGPLPSCRFKSVAAGFHSPPKPHSCFNFLLSFLFVGFVWLILTSVANLSSRWVERARWRSSQLRELFYKPRSSYTMRAVLFTGQRWNNKRHLSLWNPAIWVSFPRNHTVSILPYVEFWLTS